MGFKESLASILFTKEESNETPTPIVEPTPVEPEPPIPSTPSYDPITDPITDPIATQGFTPEVDKELVKIILTELGQNSNNVGYFSLKKAISSEIMQKIPNIKNRISLALESYKSVSPDASLEAIILEVSNMIERIKASYKDSLTKCEETYKGQSDPLFKAIYEAEQRVKEYVAKLKEEETNLLKLKAETERLNAKYMQYRANTGVTYEHVIKMLEEDKNIISNGQ